MNEELVFSGNKRIPFSVLSIQQVTDMLSSNHHLSSYTKLMTVLNKEDWQSMIDKKYELPLTTPCYHSIHLFQVHPVNEFYRMGVAIHVRDNQIPTNNEYADARISKLDPSTLK